MDISLLDVRTLLFTGATMAVASSLVLCVIAYITPYRGPGHWAGTALLAAGSLLFIGLRGVIPDGLSIAGSNTLLLWTTTSAWCGARALATQKPVNALWAALPTLPLLPLMWLLSDLGSFNERTILIMSVTAVPLFGAAVELMRRDGPPLLTRPLLTMLFFGQAALHVARVLATPLTDVESLASSSLLMKMYFLEAALFSPLLCLLCAAFIAEIAVRTVQDRAVYDPDGGYFNATGLTMVLDKELARGQRNAQPASLLVVSLDRGGPPPSQIGRPDEDERRFLNVCASTLREQDTLGRLDGHRYAIILPNTDLNDALRIAQRLRATFANLCSPDTARDARTLSLGAATAMAGISSRETLIASTIEAHDRAAEAGGDCVERASIPTLETLGTPADHLPA